MAEKTQLRAPGATVACYALAIVSAFFGALSLYTMARALRVATGGEPPPIAELEPAASLTVAFGAAFTATLLWAAGRICDDTSQMADLAWKDRNP